MFSKKQSSADEPAPKNWYADKYQSVLVQRNILAISTLFALVVALVAAFTIMQLTPLKSVAPFVIQVDDKTGIVQTVKAMTIKEISANEAVDNYFIVKYINAREVYDPADLRNNYNIVRLMSEPRIYKQFRVEKSPNNPESPAAIFKAAGKRTVTVNSVAFIENEEEKKQNRRVVNVRVTFEDRTFKNPVPLKHYRIVTLVFEYVDIDLNQQERYINPLGFRVVSYRVDEETR